MPGLAATLAGRLPVRLASPLTRDKGVGALFVPIAPAIDQPIITSGAGQNGVAFPTQTVHTFTRLGGQHHPRRHGQ